LETRTHARSHKAQEKSANHTTDVLLQQRPKNGFCPGVGCAQKLNEEKDASASIGNYNAIGAKWSSRMCRERTLCALFATGSQSD